MAKLNLGSEFLETEFTSQELYQAQRLENHTLSVAYLQNLKMEVVRQILGMRFDQVELDSVRHREYAALCGQQRILEQLIQTALEPTEPPINPEDGNSNQSQPGV